MKMNWLERFVPAGGPAGFLLLLVVGFLTALLTLGAGAPSRSSQTLQKTADDYWTFLEKERADIRLREGLPVDRLPDVSLAHAQAEAAFGKGMLGRLSRVKPAELSHDEELTLAILRGEADELVSEPSSYWLTFPVTPYIFRGVGSAQVFTSHAFRNKADADHYAMLVAQYPDLLHALEGKLRVQEKRGIRIARDEIPLVAATLAPVGREKEQNLLWVKAERLSALEPAEREAFLARLAEAIDGKVRPAATSLTGYLTGDYQKNAPEAVGLGQYRGGVDYYRAQVRRTTLPAETPERIHKVGLDGIAKLNGELDSIRQKVGFAGPLADFHKFLKSDTRFFAKTPEEVGERLMAAQTRILPKVADFFGKTPRAAFGVQRLEAQLEGAVTFGYYQTPTASDPKGYYKYNGSNLPERSLLFAGALISHELVPGHHFQINLQRENDSLPKFRREGLYTAYTEGWGEYASDLAGQMGMYEDPYDRAGRIAMDLFLTSRLVVDTGMNFYGWPRAKAIAFMKENTLQSDAEIETETLRYSCDMPAQALAYKMGMRKLVELRERARRELGPKFDIRKFHDAVLSIGSVPLDVLEKHVDWFIAMEKKGTGQPSERGWSPPE
jgi:uncharacterized protein (DUF885 family)